MTIKKLIVCTAALASAGSASASAAEPVYKLLFSPSTPGAGSEPSTILESAPGYFNFLSFGASNPGGSTVWSITSKGSLTEIYSPPAPMSLLSFVQATDGALFGNALPPTGATYYLSVGATGKDVQEYPIRDQGNGILLLQAPNGLYDELGYTKTLRNGNKITWVFSIFRPTVRSPQSIPCNPPTARWCPAPT